MKTFLFDTDIDCRACKAKVRKRFLIEDKIDKWSINAQNQLSVTGDLEGNEIVQILASLGFKAENIGGNSKKKRPLWKRLFS